MPSANGLERMRRAATTSISSSGMGADGSHTLLIAIALIGTSGTTNALGRVAGKRPCDRATSPFAGSLRPESQ